MEARRNHRDLISLTSSLLRSNIELSQRIAHLEDCYDTSETIRTTSVATTNVSRLPSVTTKFYQAYRSATRSPFGSTYAFEFERDLESSRVYRKMTRNTTDASFRSSVVQSHAWTALSDVSLSDISVISVVALPISLEDLSNIYRYDFHEASDELQEKATPLVKLVKVHDGLDAKPRMGEAIQDDPTATQPFTTLPRPAIPLQLPWPLAEQDEYSLQVPLTTEQAEGLEDYGPLASEGTEVYDVSRHWAIIHVDPTADDPSINQVQSQDCASPSDDDVQSDSSISPPTRDNPSRFDGRYCQLQRAQSSLPQTTWVPHLGLLQPPSRPKLRDSVMPT
jgi:hypothetical protein